MVEDVSSARRFPASVAILYAIFPIGILIIAAMELNAGLYAQALQDFGVAVLLTIPLAAGIARSRHHRGNFPTT